MSKGQPEQHPYRSFERCSPVRVPQAATAGDNNRNRQANQAFAERFQLTAAQGRVLKLVAQGKSNRISPILGLSGNRQGSCIGDPARAGGDQPGPGPADDDPRRLAGLTRHCRYS
jgi:hypothetical protein